MLARKKERKYEVAGYNKKDTALYGLLLLSESIKKPLARLTLPRSLIEEMYSHMPKFFC
jgi:hypothetical protein